MMMEDPLQVRDVSLINYKKGLEYELFDDEMLKGPNLDLVLPNLNASNLEQSQQYELREYIQQIQTYNNGNSNQL